MVGDWPMIRAQLPAEWKTMAAELNLVNPKPRPHLGAKITDISQVLRLVFFHVATNSSLRVTTAIAAAASIVNISAVALHLWMKKVGPYLAALLKYMTNAATTFSAERWAGYDLRVVDASVVTRPGACTTTARVHYALKLTTLEPEQIQVTDETGGETYRRFESRRGELWIGDRAYANPPGIAHLRAADADVLVRHNRGSLPLYDARGARIDVLGKCRKLAKVNRPREWAAWVHHGEERIRGRLCIVRLPEDKAKEARARVRKEQGNKVTRSSLLGAGFVLIFTTVPRERLSIARVLELYGLRWQVELHIKRDKSIAGLDKLPNFREDTIYAWICAKLLLTQIARKIAAPQDSETPEREPGLEKKNRPVEAPLFAA